MNDDWTDEDSARALGWLRIAFGATLFLMPRLGVRVWTGERIGDVTTTMAVRSLGLRDVSIGWGLITALEKGAPVRGWLEAGALADAGDAVGTLAAWRDLPKARALLWLLSEAGAAFLGYRLTQTLD